MAKKSKQTLQKREKEKARVLKRKDKEARRLESKRLRRATQLLSDMQTLTSLASVPALSPYRSSGIMLAMTV
jgi:hypothetical protein